MGASCWPSSIAKKTFWQPLAPCAARGSRCPTSTRPTPSTVSTRPWAAQPVPVRCTVPTSRIPGDPVGIASDKEEDGHHLHHPGQPLNPRRHIQHVANVGAVRIHPGRGHQPMPRHHHEDRERPQEIDAAISLGRRLLGQPSGGAPKGLHTNGQNNASLAPLDTPTEAGMVTSPRLLRVIQPLSFVDVGRCVQHNHGSMLVRHVGAVLSQATGGDR